MAKAQTYIKEITAVVKADNGGKVPDRLRLTIRRYAQAMELQDYYIEEMKSSDFGPMVYEKGSMGNMVSKQHPLCNLIYQQASICQTYEKMLGLTAAKAAAKPEDPGATKAINSLDEFIDGMKG